MRDPRPLADDGIVCKTNVSRFDVYRWIAKFRFGMFYSRPIDMAAVGVEGRSGSESSIHNYKHRQLSCGHLPRLSLSSYADIAGGREGQISRRKFSQLFAERIVPQWKNQYNGHQEIVDQAKSLCGRYLRVKLKSCATANKKLGLQRLRSVSRLNAGSVQTQPIVAVVAGQLKLLCRKLEQGHPSLYHSVLGNVGLCTLPNPNSVAHLLHTVARELFRNDITWGRVVAFFSVAGALALDCVRLGHPEFVLVLVESVGTFVDRDLAGWIAQQGGWVDLLSHCCRRTWKWSTFIVALTTMGVLLLALAITIIK